MLILLCPFPAYNHYAKNINKPVWDNEGFLTQQMTGFLYPLKEDGTTQTVYDSSTNGATLGEETVTRMKNYLILDEIEHRSCKYMAVNVSCPNNPEYSGVAKNLHETATFLLDLKMLPDNTNMTSAWIEDTFMNGSFIFADGWHLETLETKTVGITSENDLWTRAQWNVDRERTLNTDNSCLSDGSVQALEAKVGSTTVVADDTDGGQGTVPILSKCSWKITPETEPTSGRIQLDFTLLSLERNCDFLTITDVNTNRILAKFTGRSWDPLYRRDGTLPSLVTPGGPILIELTTDGMDDQPIGFSHNDGFAATFQELAASTVATAAGATAAGACTTVGTYGANCKQNSCFGTSEYQLQNAQEIITFASNVAEEKYESSSACMWFINGPSNLNLDSDSDSSTSILLTFEKLSTQFHYDQIKIYAEDDITKFDDATNLVTVLSGEYGTELHPLPVIQVHGNKVAIVFSSDGAVVDSGFQVKVQSSTLECTTDADCGGGGADSRSKCDLTSRQCRCDAVTADVSGWSGLGKNCFSPVCLTNHLQPVTPFVSEETQTGFIRSNVVNYKYESSATCNWLFEESTIDSIMGTTIGIRLSLQAWDVEESDKMEIVLHHKEAAGGDGDGGGSGGGGGGGGRGGGKSGRRLGGGDGGASSGGGGGDTPADDGSGTPADDGSSNDATCAAASALTPRWDGGTDTCVADGTNDSSCQAINSGSLPTFSLATNKCVALIELKYTVVDLKDGKCRCGIDKGDATIINIDSACIKMDDCNIEITNDDWVKIEVRFNTDINNVADGFVFKYVPIRSPCNKGEYNVDSLPAGYDNEGKPGCLKCNAGSYNDDGNAYQCTTCPKGFEQKDAGQNSCKACRTGGINTFALLPGQQKCAVDHDEVEVNADNTQRCLKGVWFPNPPEHVTPIRKIKGGESNLRPIRMGYNHFRESSFRLTDYFSIVFLEMLGYSFELVKFDSDALVLTALSNEEIDMALEAWITGSAQAVACGLETGAVDLPTTIYSFGNAEYHTGPAWFYSVVFKDGGYKDTNQAGSAWFTSLYRRAFDDINAYKDTNIQEIMSEVANETRLVKLLQMPQAEDLSPEERAAFVRTLEKAVAEYKEKSIIENTTITSWESTACKKSGICIDVFSSDKCLQNDGGAATCEDFDDATLLSIAENNGLAVRSKRTPDNEFKTFIDARSGGPSGKLIPSIFHSHEPSVIMSERTFLRKIDLKLEKKHTVQMLITTSFFKDANFLDAVNLLSKHRFTNTMMLKLMNADIRFPGTENEYSASCVYAQTCLEALSMNAKDTRQKALYIGTIEGDVVSEIKGTIFRNMLRDIFKLDVFLQPVASSMALLWGLNIGDIDIALSFKPASGEKLYPYMLNNGELIVESVSDETDQIGLYAILLGGKDNTFCDETCQNLIHNHYLSFYQATMIASLPTMNTLATMTDSTAAMDGTLLCDPLMYSWCTAQPGTRGMYIPEQCTTASPLYTAPCGEIYATSLEAIYRPGALEELVAAHDYKLAVVFTTQEKIAEVIKRSEYYGGNGQYNHIMMASCPKCSSYHYVSTAVGGGGGGGGEEGGEEKEVDFQKVKFSAWEDSMCLESLITSRVLQKYHTTVTDDTITQPVESLIQSSCCGGHVIATCKNCFHCDTDPTAAEVTLRGSRAPVPGQFKQLDQLLSEFDVCHQEMDVLLSLHESMPGGTLTTEEVATHYNLNAPRPTKSQPDRMLSDILFRGCDDQDGYYGYWGICQACPMGKYGPPGANECIDCSPGTYAPNAGQSECSTVKDQEFVNIFGANETKLCGDYSASGGSGLVTMGVQDPG